MATSQLCCGVVRVVGLCREASGVASYQMEARAPRASGVGRGGVAVDPTVVADSSAARSPHHGCSRVLRVHVVVAIFYR